MKNIHAMSRRTIFFMAALCSFFVVVSSTIKKGPQIIHIPISQIPAGAHIETGIFPADAPDVWYDASWHAVVVHGNGAVPSYDVEVSDSSGVPVTSLTVSGAATTYVLLPDPMTAGAATVTISTPWGNVYEGQFTP